MFASLDERLTIGWMLCPEFSVLKERTTVNLSASLARALTPSSDENDKPPSLSVPTRSSSRRFIGFWPSKIVSIVLLGNISYALGQVLPEKRGKNGLLFDQF